MSLEEAAERAADKDARNKWVGVFIGVLAVLLAICNVGGANATKDATHSNIAVSDTWAFYQAKVIREHLYRAQKMRLEADLADRAPGAAREKHEALLRKLDEEEKRYNAEKKDIEKDAKKLEAVRDGFQARDPYFLVGEALLQIAIVMSSVSILGRSRLIFSFSLVLAVAGGLLTINGYFPVFHLPFFHGGH